MHVDYTTLKYIFFIFVINEKQSGTGNTIMAEPEYKRPRGLETCQQHCKISATGVSENVYLCSKLHYHKNKICIGR